MIEFGLKRARNGKRSRWSRKYPRKRILNRGDEKAANWFRSNWIDDNYRYFRGDLHKFLLSNVGRPVDKVFSEFLDRCRKSANVYNLRKWFYDMFEEKSEINWSGGFYITNGILNCKKRTKRPKSKSYTFMEDYNRKAMPDMTPLCKECETTHTKQLMGVFKLAYNVQKRVYIVERSVYESDYNLKSHYELCSIYGVGKGMTKYIFNPQDKMYRVSYGLWDGWNWRDCPNPPEFVFITKIERV